MSEPASLYARLTFDADGFQRFIDAPPAQPFHFSDWQGWFDRHHMTGGNGVPTPLHDLEATRVGAILDGWQQDPRSGTGPITWNPTDGTCRITMPQASENFHEMLYLLTPLRGAAASTRPGCDDFIVLFDVLWGDGDVSAYLTIDDAGSRFQDTLPAAHRDEATHHLEQILARLQQAD